MPCCRSMRIRADVSGLSFILSISFPKTRTASRFLVYNTRMPSLLSNPNRPIPQQERGARTHQLFLDTAERLFVEVGYDAMTMTAVAERAGTSIGALYRWFPDKTAVPAALPAPQTAE